MSRQGRRYGKMVIGAMSAAPLTESEYSSRALMRQRQFKQLIKYIRTLQDKETIKRILDHYILDDTFTTDKNRIIFMCCHSQIRRITKEK